MKAERRKSLAISGLTDFRSISDSEMVTDVKTHYLQYKSGELHESDRSSFEKSVLLYSENTSGTSSKIHVISEKSTQFCFCIRCLHFS